VVMDTYKSQNETNGVLDLVSNSKFKDYQFWISNNTCQRYDAMISVCNKGLALSPVELSFLSPATTEMP
jgi:hypothetical protein